MAPSRMNTEKVPYHVLDVNGPMESKSCGLQFKMRPSDDHVSCIITANNNLYFMKTF